MDKHREPKESTRFNNNATIFAVIVLIIVVAVWIYLYKPKTTVPQIQNPPNQVQSTRSY